MKKQKRKQTAKLILSDPGIQETPNIVLTDHEDSIEVDVASVEETEEKKSKNRGRPKKISGFELMPEPNDGRVVEKEAKLSDNGVGMPEDKLTVSQFRGQIAMLPSEEVVPYFVRLFKAEKLINARATVIELKRLGYSKELAEHNVSIKSNQDE